MDSKDAGVFSIFTEDLTSRRCPTNDWCPAPVSSPLRHQSHVWSLPRSTGERKGERKVDRVTANHSLSSTASQGTSNIPFPCFLVLGCNRQAQGRRVAVTCHDEKKARNMSGSKEDSCPAQVNAGPRREMNPPSYRSTYRYGSLVWMVNGEERYQTNE